jgi:VCBS repeat-containing protein
MLNQIARWLKHRPAPFGRGARKIRLDCLEDRAVPAATLSINDVSLTEGNSGHKDFVFTVTLSEPSAQSVTLQYATAEDTALDNTDFMRIPNGNLTPPTLTFVPGQTTQTITVRVKGDTTPEVNETFFVNLSGAVNATIGDGQGVGTILNDDNHAPVAADQGASTAEDAALTGSVTATDVDGDALSYAVVAGPSHGTLALNPDGSFTYTPAADYNGSDSFTFAASDGALTSNTATVAITVTPGNDAPVLTGGAILDGVVEADADPLGQTVETLFGRLVNDTDAGDSLAGIAVVGTTPNTDHGSWEYSTDGGANWFEIGTVGNSTALALAADTMIRFLPALGFSGDPAPLVVRAIDSSFPGPFTDGATRATVDVATAGGTTAFSAATATLQSPVASVSGAWLSDTGNVYVTGTSGNDTIVVRQATPGRVLVVLNGAVIGDFPRTQVTGRLRVRGMDGNDQFKVSVRMANPADLYGGLGNDTLIGGSRSDRLFGEAGADSLRGRGGNDVLVGGDGNDTLGGGADRDVFIGGMGADYVLGAWGSDLLIGGSTDFEHNPTALTAIATEWASSSSYEDRVAHLTTTSGGQNGTTYLNATNVHDDGVADVVKGGSGRDWFWTADLDQFIRGGSEVSSRS